MSKAAVELLMRSIAQNHGEHGIRCNIVAPGPTETNMVKEFFDEEKRQRVTKEIPLRRFGDPKGNCSGCIILCQRYVKLCNRSKNPRRWWKNYKII